MKTTTKYTYYEGPNCKYRMTDTEVELVKLDFLCPSCNEVKISEFRTGEKRVQR